MFTCKDIGFRTILVINCIEKRNLRVSNGELLLEADDGDSKTTLTKLPFQKILVLFIIGHISITTPLIDKCKKFNVSLIVVKPNFRPVFFWAQSAEGNYLLRQKQYAFKKDDITIAKAIVLNKIANQLSMLNKTRLKDPLTVKAQDICDEALIKICQVTDYNILMGIEGVVSKAFFSAYYKNSDWTSRKPHTKVDALNATLDIGYTILFNYVESFVRMFGFDVYIGVYHRLWFKRKSLVCDLMEPFRCLIDRTVRNAYNRKQCSKEDFCIIKNEYKLKYEKNGEYTHLFFEALIPYKTDVFKYIQGYYRCFMRDKQIKDYPQFLI